MNIPLAVVGLAIVVAGICCVTFQNRAGAASDKVRKSMWPSSERSKKVNYPGNKATRDAGFVLIVGGVALGIASFFL